MDASRCRCFDVIFSLRGCDKGEDSTMHRLATGEKRNVSILQRYDAGDSFIGSGVTHRKDGDFSEATNSLRLLQNTVPSQISTTSLGTQVKTGK
jgi:hypothetical protein